jgi:hypothetical protein
MRASVAFGVAAGLVLTAAVLLLEERQHPATKIETGPVLAESTGGIKELVIHYVKGEKQIAGELYREFLSQLGSNVVVHAVVPDEEAYRELAEYLGPLKKRLHPIVTGHVITGWSRDRWLAFEPREAEDGVLLLLAPRGERLAEAWPARAGDQLVAEDIARVLPDVVARRSDLLFDGGDFTADEQTVFVAPEVVLRNVQVTIEHKEALLRALSLLLKRNVVVLDKAPKHHTGMFMMVAGDKTVLVSDPSLGKRLLAQQSLAPSQLAAMLPGGVDFSEDTQRLYDAVAEQARAAGYRVVRIPSLHGAEGKMYITYVNVIIDSPGRQRIVYLPVYNSLDVLNEAAVKTWQQLGYEVRPVNVSSVYKEGGTLHCLVNILRREKIEDSQQNPRPDQQLG